MAALTNVLFLLSFGLTVTTEVVFQKRIIAGRNCNDQERPYQVKFEYPPGSNRCGGSLISDRWILTAAHCWNDSIPMKAILSPHPGPGQEALFFKSPRFLNEGSSRPDIMLLELEQTTTTPFIPLPDCENKRIEKGDVVQIAGYGSNQVDHEKKKIPVKVQVLQCADFTVEDDETFMYIDNNISTRVFRVNTDQADTSPGDSGGGVVFNNAIYGVHIEGGPIAHATKAAFADVCHYIDSIKQIMSLHV